MDTSLAEPVEQERTEARPMRMIKIYCQLAIDVYGWMGFGWRLSGCQSLLSSGKMPLGREIFYFFTPELAGKFSTTNLLQDKRINMTKISSRSTLLSTAVMLGPLSVSDLA